MPGTLELTIVCECNCPRGTLFTTSGGSVDAWREVIQNNAMGPFTCRDCGCTYHFDDKGDSVGQKDQSVPILSSVSRTSGPHEGGTTVTLTGHAFDVGTVVISFNGVVATNKMTQSENGDLWVIDTPPGIVGPATVRVQNEHGFRDYPKVFKYT